MKKTYQTPSLNLQEFATNESVAACYLVYCDGHNDLPHGDRTNGKPVWAVTEEDLLAAGVPESDFQILQEWNDPNISRCNYDITLALGTDEAMVHSQILVSYDPDTTNFGS